MTNHSQLLSIAPALDTVYLEHTLTRNNKPNIHTHTITVIPDDGTITITTPSPISSLILKTGNNVARSRPDERQTFLT
jgi:hypothetical protein